MPLTKEERAKRRAKRKTTKAEGTEPDENSRNVVTIRDGAGNKLPAKYAAQARGFDVPQFERLRLFLSGGIGEGKTHLACSLHNACYLDVENKAGHIKNFRYGGRYNFKSGGDYDAIIEMLIEDGMNNDRAFDCVVIDTIDAYQGVQRTFMSEEAGVDDITRTGQKGHGWDLLNHKICQQIQDLYNAGYGWCIISHAYLQRNEDGASQYRLSCSPSMMKYLYGQCEFSGRVYVDNPEVEYQVMRKGKPVTRTKIDYENVAHYLDLVPNSHVDRDDTGRMVDNRMHIPIAEEPIPLPATDGMAEVKKLYDAAVAAL